MDAKHSNELVNNLLSTLDERKIKIPEFARQTGIPKDRVYKWIQEGTNPKSEDVRTILAWLDNTQAQPKMEKHPPNEKHADNIHLATADRLLEQVEARRKDFEKWADLARQDKEKAEKEKDRLYNIIETSLNKILEVSLMLSANSKEVKDNMAYAVIEMQSEHRAIMDTLDKIGGLPVGTTVGKADILEDAAHAGMKKSSSKPVPGKERTPRA